MKFLATPYSIDELQDIWLDAQAAPVEQENNSDQARCRKRFKQLKTIGKAVCLALMGIALIYCVHLLLHR